MIIAKQQREHREITVRPVQDIETESRTVQAMTDDGMPIEREARPRLPQELIDRHRDAAAAFYRVQAEIQQLLFEQDWGT
jgi:hypothetical protein